MQDLKCSVTLLVLAALVMNAAAAPSGGPVPLRRRTNHTSAEFDEFWGVPDDNLLLNRGAFEGQGFADDGGALMEHGILTDDGQVKNLEVIGSEDAGNLWRFGNSNNGADTVFFNEDDFAPDSEDAANEFLEPKMLLSPGEEINEDLKRPGYDWSVMGKVNRVTTTQKPSNNIHFFAEENAEAKPWEANSRPSSR